MTQCICSDIPNNRRLEFWHGAKLTHVTHRDCQDHGVIWGLARPAREVVHKEWLSTEEFRRLPLTGVRKAKIWEKTADGKRALVEWSTWEGYEEDDSDTDGVVNSANEA